MPRRKKYSQSYQLGEEITNKEVRKQVVSILQRGIESEFWTYLCKILDMNSEECRRHILEDDFETLEEVVEWKNKLYYQTQLRKLPEIMVERLSTQLKKNEELSLDPYEV